MPVIKISQKNYTILKKMMAEKIKKKINSDPNTLFDIGNKKFGVTFDEIITELVTR